MYKNTILFIAILALSLIVPSLGLADTSSAQCTSYLDCVLVNGDPEEVNVRTEDTSRYWSESSFISAALRVYEDTWMKLNNKLGEEFEQCREIGRASEQCLASAKLVSHNVGMKISFPDPVVGSCPKEKKELEPKEFNVEFEELITIEWMVNHHEGRYTPEEVAPYFNCEDLEEMCQTMLHIHISAAGDQCLPECWGEVMAEKVDKFCVPVSDTAIHVGCSAKGSVKCVDAAYTSLLGGSKVKIEGEGAGCVDCQLTGTIPVTPIYPHSIGE